MIRTSFTIIRLLRVRADRPLLRHKLSRRLLLRRRRGSTWIRAKRPVSSLNRTVAYVLERYLGWSLDRLINGSFGVMGPMIMSVDDQKEKPRGPPMNPVLYYWLSRHRSCGSRLDVYYITFQYRAQQYIHLGNSHKKP